MRGKQSVILPEGNVLVKDFVTWLTTVYVCIFQGIRHNYHTIYMSGIKSTGFSRYQRLMSIYLLQI
jgi:hypothetical protein